jgi:repressor LexA
MQELNSKEMAVYQFLQKYISERGYPPTVRDICAALNIKSTSTVHKMIGILQDKGYIKKPDPNKRRALELTDKSALQPKTEPLPEREGVTDVPVVGRIAAGTPILAEQNIEDSFPLPTRYLGKGNNFMLTVHGDSMIEAGIFDGDYILVEEQSNAENGDIVVAMIDGIESEATVKTFYKEKGHIRLQPQNPAMDPIIVPDCRIVGKVKGVFRYFS